MVDKIKATHGVANSYSVELVYDKTNFREILRSADALTSVRSAGGICGNA